MFLVVPPLLSGGFFNRQGLILILLWGDYFSGKDRLPDPGAMLVATVQPAKGIDSLCSSVTSQATNYAISGDVIDLLPLVRL